MKNTFLKIGFAAALLVRFFMPSLIQFNGFHLHVNSPVHFSDGKVIVPVVKRAAFLHSGFVIVDVERGLLRFSPIRNDRGDAASVCSICSLNTFNAENACVNSNVSLIHFRPNTHIPELSRTMVKNVRDKVFQRIKKDLGIKNDHSKNDCDKHRQN
jgi:hypothetical protein